MKRTPAMSQSFRLTVLVLAMPVRLLLSLAAPVRVDASGRRTASI